MSPEEMKQRVVTAVETEQRRGFTLCQREFGDSKSGCALTATYYNEAVDKKWVSGGVIRRWAFDTFGIQETTGFIAGFDGETEDTNPKNQAYYELGQELRERFHPIDRTDNDGDPDA